MENQLSFDIISLLASIASLILAIVAIWLSVVFYRMSNEASKATTEAAKGIAASVDRLEKLFDKLYSDTFSMMKDTVSDMRKHIWPTEENEQEKIIEEAEKKADEKIIELKNQMDSQVADMLKRQNLADDKMSSLRNEMGRLLDRAMVSSRQVESEARDETIREHILNLIKNRTSNRLLRVDDILMKLSNNFPIARVFQEIEKMKIDGIIEIDSNEIDPSTIIRLKRKYH